FTAVGGAQKLPTLLSALKAVALAAPVTHSCPLVSAGDPNPVRRRPDRGQPRRAPDSAPTCREGCFRPRPPGQNVRPSPAAAWPSTPVGRAGVWWYGVWPWLSGGQARTAALTIGRRPHGSTRRIRDRHR